MKTILTTLLLIFLSVPALSQAPVIPPNLDSLNVLHYTETTGWNHNTKNDSKIMLEAFMDSLEQIHPGTIFTLVTDDNGSEFNDLSRFYIVIFSNTTGNSGLNATQRANFEAFILGGGNYLGIHAATDFYRHSTANGKKTGDWDWYAENVAGASVQESPNHTSSSHIDSVFIDLIAYPELSANLPALWIKEEEYYYWENGYLAPGWTEIASVGQTGSNSYDAPRMVAHFKDLPWGGLAFYTSLGHKDDNFEDYDDPSKEFYYFGVMILNALEEMTPDPPTTFGINESLLTPEEVAYQGLNPAFFHFEDQQPDPTYQVFSITGQHILTASFDGWKLPRYSQPGYWIYKSNGMTWSAAVR